MSIANGTHNAHKVLDQYRALIASMINDQGKVDHKYVLLWNALSEALESADALHDAYNAQLKLNKMKR